MAGVGSSSWPAAPTWSSRRSRRARSRAGEWGRPRSLEQNPALIVTSITDFGQDGPYRDYTGTDMVGFAMGGLMSRSGRPERPPLVAPGNLAYDATGIAAAHATLLGFYQRLRTGRGQHLDVSVFEAVSNLSDGSLPGFSVNPTVVHRTGTGIYPLYRCADGWVRMLILVPSHWRTLMTWMDHPEELADPAYEQFLHRLMNMDKINAVIDRFFADKPKIDAAKEAQRRGITATPLLLPSEVLDNEHTVARRTFVRTPVGAGIEARLPSGFVTIDGERSGPAGGPPELGELGDGGWSEEGRDRVAAMEAAAPGAGAGRLPPARPAGHRLRGRCRRRRGRAPLRRVRRRRHQDRDSPRARLLPCDLRQLHEPQLRVVEPDEAEFRGRPEDRARDCARPGAGADGRRVHREQRHGRHRATRVRAGGAARAQPPHGQLLQPARRQRRAVEGLDRLRAQHPPARRAPVPVELSRGRGPPGRIHEHVPRPLRRPRRGIDGPGRTDQPARDRRRIAPRRGPVRGGPRPHRRPPGQGGPVAGQRRAAGQPQPPRRPVGLLPVLRRRRVVRHQRAGGPRMAVARPGDGLAVVGRRRPVRHRDVAAGRTATRSIAASPRWTATLDASVVFATVQAVGVPAGIVTHGGHLLGDPQLAHRGYAKVVDQQGVGTMMMEGPAFLGTDIPEPIVTQAPWIGEHTREIARDLLGLSAPEIEQLVADGVLEDPPEVFVPPAPSP